MTIYICCRTHETLKRRESQLVAELQDGWDEYLKKAAFNMTHRDKLLPSSPHSS